MRSRYLAAGAAAWVIAFSVLYVVIIRSQDDGSVAWWFVGLLVVAAAALASYAGGIALKPALVVGLLLCSVATLLGLLSIGILMVPAVAAAAAALATDRRTQLSV
jgi:glycerol uptake facilitator-like aquaporin